MQAMIANKKIEKSSLLQKLQRSDPVLAMKLI